jgi:phosphate uptake regulator
MSYLDELVAQLKDIREFPQPPDNPVEEGDTVVGELTDDLKRLFALREMMGVRLEKQGRGLMHLKVDLLGKKTTEAEKAHYEKEKIAAQRTELEGGAVNTLFWTSLRLTFPALIGKDTIKIHTDWKVSWSKREVQEISLAELLGL